MQNIIIHFSVISLKKYCIHCWTFWKRGNKPVQGLVTGTPAEQKQLKSEINSIWELNNDDTKIFKLKEAQK